LGQQYLYESTEILEAADNNPTTREQVIKQMGRLGDSIFTLGHVEFDEYYAFIPAKLLNNARREIVDKLYEAKINSQQKRTKAPAPKDKLAFAGRKPYLTASVTTKTQYDACKKAGIEEIYFDQIVRRNQITYPEREGELLIGGYGGIYAYKDTNDFVTDYSLNVVNATSCYELHKLGAKRVTLSYELNKKQINDLLTAYYEANEGYPALEMIVYGRAPLLFTKYCPLKKMGQCGICKTKSYEIKDEYGTFPILSHDDCTTTILNGKILNLLDEMPFIEGVEAFRLNFTTESAEEVADVVKAAQAKLDGRLPESLFNQETDTRGHFNKEII
jgi:putative protease